MFFSIQTGEIEINSYSMYYYLCYITCKMTSVPFLSFDLSLPCPSHLYLPVLGSCLSCLIRGNPWGRFPVMAEITCCNTFTKDVNHARACSQYFTDNFSCKNCLRMFSAITGKPDWESGSEQVILIFSLLQCVKDFNIPSILGLE